MVTLSIIGLIDVLFCNAKTWIIIGAIVAAIVIITKKKKTQ